MEIFTCEILVTFGVPYNFGMKEFINNLLNCEDKKFVSVKNQKEISSNKGNEGEGGWIVKRCKRSMKEKKMELT